jgi:hypothetical protein
MKIGVLLEDAFEDPGEFLADARALETAGVAALWVEAQPGRDGLQLLAAVAAVTGRARLGLITNSEGAAAAAMARLPTLQRLSHSRAMIGVRDGADVRAGSERWQATAMPGDRAAFQRLAATHADAAILLSMQPRLLDLLRRPESDDDRSDLQLSQG